LLAQLHKEGSHYNGTLLKMSASADANFFLMRDPNMVLQADQLVAASTFAKHVAFNDHQCSTALQDNYPSISRVIQDVYGGTGQATDAASLAAAGAAGAAADTIKEKIDSVRNGMGAKIADFMRVKSTKTRNDLELDDGEEEPQLPLKTCSYRLFDMKQTLTKDKTAFDEGVQRMITDKIVAIRRGSALGRVREP